MALGQGARSENLGGHSAGVHWTRAIARFKEGGLFAFKMRSEVELWHGRSGSRFLSALGAPCPGWRSCSRAGCQPTGDPSTPY